MPNEVVLVTGAAKRIGRGIALRLAREGARVAIHYHNSEADARSTAEECGGAELFPWMLDGASADTSKRVLSMLPPPARLLYRAVWRPRYARTPRWNTSTAQTRAVRAAL